jgi:site-specific DNA-cytosine methylase
MGLKVLSLFDGMSCGRLALDRAGIPVDKYYASEIDKFAIKVAQENYPDTIQLGDVNGFEDWDIEGPIDLLIGGSPCQDFSIMKSKSRRGLDGEKSGLFFKYFECWVKYRPKYFLLENVLMSKEDEDIISYYLGVKPVMINSSYFSAQDRKRLYWTNIPMDLLGVEPSPLVIEDIMEKDADEKYFYDLPLKYHGEDKRVIVELIKERGLQDKMKRVYNPKFKAPTLTAVTGGNRQEKVFDKGRARKMTPLEYERLQTVPDGYTASCSDTQRWKMLGNGWTVDVISFILSGVLPE